MIKIRKSVWETNSSSSHSVSVAGGDKQMVLDTIYPDQNGRIYVDGGEFGWEWGKFNDAVTKLSYAYQDGVDIELLERVVKDHTGAEEVIFRDRDNGYIDHDSVGTAQEVCGTFDDASNFIFNKNSWLFTGNDNGTPDPTFYHVPVYMDGKMFKPEYKYELVIDGLKKTTKFMSEPTEEDISDGVTALMDDILMYSNGTLNENVTLEFKLMRTTRDMFQKSYWVEQDYTLGYIIMVKEDYPRELRRVLEEDPEYKELSYHERAIQLRNAVLADEENHRKLRFTINEINE